MKVKTKFDFYSDPGHGWLKVPMSLLDALGVRGRITTFSYQRGENAYLEEDCDATVFWNAYKERFGREPKIKHHLADRSSAIRAYASFSPIR